MSYTNQDEKYLTNTSSILEDTITREDEGDASDDEEVELQFDIDYEEI